MSRLDLLSRLGLAGGGVALSVQLTLAHLQMEQQLHCTPPATATQWIEEIRQKAKEFLEHE